MKSNNVCQLGVLFTAMVLSGCQTVPTGTELIAKVFNTSTQLQSQWIDRHAPQDIKVIHDIKYSEEPNLTLDVYQAQTIPLLQSRPTIVWIHGGGWISGSKTHGAGYFKRLAEQGYHVVAIEYQFAPQASYPTQLKQIDQALAFVTTHAGQYGIDSQHLYLAGDSAGANLASHYAALLTNDKFAQQSNFQPSILAQQLKGLILHCGIYDLAQFVETAPNEMKLIEWGVVKLVQAYVGTKDQDVDFLKSISPSHHITAHYPAVFISGGKHDFLTETQSVPFEKVLKAHQISVNAAFYPESKEVLLHEYQFMMSKKASQATFWRSIDFIRQNSPGF